MREDCSLPLTPSNHRNCRKLNNLINMSPHFSQMVSSGQSTLRSGYASGEQKPLWTPPIRASIRVFRLSPEPSTLTSKKRLSNKAHWKTSFIFSQGRRALAENDGRLYTWSEWKVGHVTVPWRSVSAIGN